MFFKIFIFTVNILLFVTVMFIGYLLYKNPPKKINNIFGYRSKNSMSSQQIWDFANKYWGQLIFKSEITIIVIIIFSGFFIGNKEDKIVIASIFFIILQFLSIFGSIFIVEKEIKKRFK